MASEKSAAIGGERRSGRGSGGSGRLNGYLLSWVGLAAFALGYITVAAARPDLLSSVLPVADHSGEQISGARSAADIADELTSLRKWVNDLQHELQSTKATVRSQADQNQALKERLAAAEERLTTLREAKVDAATPPPGGAPPAHAAKVAKAPLHKPADAATVVAAVDAAHGKIAAQPPADTSGVKVLNSGTVSDITTGSVTSAASAAAGAAAPVQPVAAPAAGPQRGIEIADAELLEGLKTRWNDLTMQNGAVLKPLAPRYKISANGGASPFTLLAGPFATTAEAAKACAQLKSGGVPCRVTDFSGNGL